LIQVNWKEKNPSDNDFVDLGKPPIRNEIFESKSSSKIIGAQPPSLTEM
jgi:hypothetical protein